MRKKQFTFCFLLFLLLQNSIVAKAYDGEKFTITKQQNLLLNEIVESLESNHLIKKEYIDIKDEAFVLYLERLDPNKTIFLSRELIGFEKEIKNSDEIEHGLQQAFLIFKKYKERYLDRYNFQLNFLSEVVKKDLQTNKLLLRDRSDANRLDSVTELKTLWKELIINDLIQLRLSNNSLDESKNKII